MTGKMVMRAKPMHLERPLYQVFVVPMGGLDPADFTG